MSLSVMWTCNWNCRTVQDSAGQCRTYLEVWQEATVSLVTSLSPGREAARHHHSYCQGDGNLWESHTLCHCSDTFRKDGG